MDLVEFIVSQGVDQGLAKELAERKKKSPSLTGVVVGSKWVSLSPSTGEKFNEMVASGGVPGCVTDSTFLQGTCNGSQFQSNPAQGDHYRKQCEAEGGSVLGKKYFSQLAQHPGDKRAWCSSRGEVQKRLEELGWGSDGSVKVKERERTEPIPKPIPIAEHIVDRETARELVGKGEISVKEYKKVRAKVKRRITPPSKREQRG